MLLGQQLITPVWQDTARLQSAEAEPGGEDHGRTLQSSSSGAIRSDTSSQRSQHPNSMAPAQRASLSDIRENLWKEAAFRLEKKDAELFQRFQECLEARTIDTNSARTSCLSRRTGQADIDFERAESAILQRVQDIQAKPNKSKFAKLEDCLVKIAQALKAVKPAVSEVISGSLYASIAWSGICLILPVLLNHSEQLEKSTEGLTYISTLVLQYRHRERLYAIGPDSRDFERLVVPLYAAILEYEARLICQVSRRLVNQYLRDVFKTDDWEKLMQRIEELDKNCKSFTQDIRIRRTAEAHEQLLEIQRSILANNKRIQGDKAEEKRNRWLRSLYSTYEYFKDLNPQRVDGTCEWFLSHIVFLAWREKQSWALLWVSGDPGCGKSVLSRHLVDNAQVLLTSCLEPVTVCYFFFKDGDPERQHGHNALCAILSQIFQKRPWLFDVVQQEFDTKGERLLSDFDSLWKILVKVASQQTAGEIICVLDALDECDHAESERVIHTLMSKTSASQLSNNSAIYLKFIVTSRPYHRIEESFNSLAETANMIRLFGEHQSKQIGHEINLVIEHEVPRIARQLAPESRQYLISKLKKIENRTYLWLRLVFEVIRKNYISRMKKTTEATHRELTRLVDELPLTVESAYKDLLEKGSSPIYAKRLLQLIMAAQRPLTIHEANVALTMFESWDDAVEGASTFSSESDLLDHLDSTEAIELKVKESCGLLVVISDSKLHLLHQTVREYLLKGGSSLPRGWQWAFNSTFLHNFMSGLSISYLLFPEMLGLPLPPPENLNSPLWRYKWEVTKEREKLRATFLDNHCFLDYTARHWPLHLRSACSEVQQRFLKDSRRLCDINSVHFRPWHEVAYRDSRLDRYIKPPTSISVAAGLGLSRVVDDILRQDRVLELDGARDILGQAMFKASEAGHYSTVLYLLDQNASIWSGMGHSLAAAVWHGFPDVVRLLLSKTGTNVNSRLTYAGESCPHIYVGTPLCIAAWKGHTEVVELLLREGALPDSQHVSPYLLPLPAASRSGHMDVVKLLLEANANPNLGGRGADALNYIEEYCRIDVIESLLQHHAMIKRGRGSGLLTAAVLTGSPALVQRLIRRGRYIDEPSWSGSALCIAVTTGNIKMAEMLLVNGANPNPLSPYHQTVKITGSPLTIAARTGDIHMLRLLIHYGADLNKIAGDFAPSALQVAAAAGQLDAVQYLIDQGANVDLCGHTGTALHFAVLFGQLEALKLLLKSKAAVELPFQGPYLQLPGIFNQRPPARAPLPNFTRGTALQLAVGHGYLEVTKLLLDHGADINTSFCSDQSVLFIALKRGHYDLSALLSQHPHLNWEAQVPRCVVWTVIHSFPDILYTIFSRAPAIVRASLDMAVKFAAKNGSATILKWFINQFPGSIQNEVAAFSLRLAARHGNMACVQLLINAGADVNSSGLCVLTDKRNSPIISPPSDHSRECKPKFGKSATALQAAAAAGHLEIVSLLIDHGAEVNLKEENTTALQLASGFARSRVVEKLISCGANVNDEGGVYGSALQQAASGRSIYGTEFEFDWKEPSRIRRHEREESDSLSTLRILLSNNATVESATGEYGTALQRAAEAGFLRILKLLLGQGANINADGGRFGTALQRAVDRHHLEIVGLLIANDADVNAPGGELGTALQRASERGYADIVKQLLDAGADVNAGTNGTPLQKAAAANKPDIVQLLLEHGAKMTNNGGCYMEKEPWSIHPKHRIMFHSTIHAALRKPLKANFTGVILKPLLQANAQFEGEMALSDWKEAVHTVIPRGDPDLLQLLVERSPKMKDLDLLEPAYEITASGNVAMLRVFLSNIKDLSAFQKSDFAIKAQHRKESICGLDLLPQAAAGGHLDILRLLVEDYGFSVHGSSPRLGSPIYQASNCGSIHALKYLLANGASVNNKDGSSALAIAAAGGYLDIMRLLLEANAPYCVVRSQEALDTPLIAAAKHGRERVVEFLLTVPELVFSDEELIIARGCALEQEFYPVSWRISTHLDDAMITLAEFTRREESRLEDECELRRAAVKNDMSKVNHLLSSGVDVNADVGSLGTALQYAAGRGHLRIVEVLLAAKAEVNLTGGLEWTEDMPSVAEIDGHEDLLSSGTALERAALGGHTEICALLLKHHARLTPNGYLGLSAIERAAGNGHTETVELLAKVDPLSVDSWTGARSGTALQRASKRGYTDVVRILLQYGANANSCVGEYGTALQLAALDGHVQVIDLLIRHGAEIDATMPNRISATPLWLSADGGFTEAAKLLIDHGADLDWQLKGNRLSYDPRAYFVGTDPRRRMFKVNGTTPLQAAILSRRLDVVEILRAAGASDEPVEEIAMY